MDFFKLITGGQEASHILAFIFFALFGMFFIKLLRYNIKRKKLLRKRPPVVLEFNLPIWISDNLLDFILAFMAAYACFIFFPDLLSWVNKIFPTLSAFSDKMSYGLLLGVFFQFISHKLLNSVKI